MVTAPARSAARCSSWGAPSVVWSRRSVRAVPGRSPIATALRAVA